MKTYIEFLLARPFPALFGCIVIGRHSISSLSTSFFLSFWLLHPISWLCNNRMGHFFYLLFYYFSSISRYRLQCLSICLFVCQTWKKPTPWTPRSSTFNKVFPPNWTVFPPNLHLRTYKLEITSKISSSYPLNDYKDVNTM